MPTCIARALLWVALGLLLQGCVQPYLERADNERALLMTSQRVLLVDGVTPDDPYRISLSPGRHVLQVQYRTYREQFDCRFELDAIGGRVYEIVDHSNPEPLVLYRWTRSNGLWAERRDPLRPVCAGVTGSGR